MSRLCPDKDIAPILEAAQHWKSVCAVGDGSVFTDATTWTTEHLNELVTHFIDQPDESDDKFLPKLERQLSEASSGTKRLAAEMLWFMFLCPSNVGAEKKRDNIQRVWAWSGSPPLAGDRWMSDAVLGGVGSGGRSFNTNRWRELTMLVRFTLKIKGKRPDERVALFTNAEALAEAIESVPEGGSRQLRHMILFLLFPDEHERIFSASDRRAVVAAFGHVPLDDVDELSPRQIDRNLLAIRQQLEGEHQTSTVDFYASPWAERWQSTTLRRAADQVTASHVLEAIAEIDSNGIPADARSARYDLLHEGRRFPPKYVLSLAAKAATGHPLDRASFTGGQESTAFKILRDLGYVIVTKDSESDDDGVTKLVSKFLEQAKRGDDLSVQGFPKRYRELDVKVSFGKGNFARIPWIAFLGHRQSVSEGIYPVFLLFQDEGVLVLCDGVSEENEAALAWPNADGLQTVRTWFREKYGRNPDRYRESLVRAVYDLSKPLPGASLKGELDAAIDEYQKVLRARLPEPPLTQPDTRIHPIRENVGDAVREFASSLQNCHVSFGEAHDEVVASFIASLLTKPLVILTGLSGSGKTQIAMRFGEWLGDDRLHVAAVRPDWTGAEALFGYEDGLKPALDGRAAWHVPAPLAFMLKAAEDSAHPHLLLLDEMNLAHVERYFADVLSGMESGHPCLPNLIKGTDGVWRPRVNARSHISFPRNLWLVGTVNVDETTYMFSPKVLDRANTFEFRVGGGDLRSDAKKPVRCEQAADSLVRALCAIGADDAWQLDYPPSFASDVGRYLRQLHQLLSLHDLEFGHRVFYESLRFAALAEQAGIDTVERVLDRIVMQKVMPRLHGSRKRLEQPLVGLLQFCRDLPNEVQEPARASTVSVEHDLGGVKLPISYSKASRMLRALRANQFASFTE